MHSYLTEDPPFCTRYPLNPEIRLVPVIVSGTNQRMLIWELTLYNLVFLHVQHHPELIFNWSTKMPKATQKSVTTGEDIEEVDKDIPLHGTINEEEVRVYRESLDKVFDDMATNIEVHVANTMELAIMDLKTEIVKQIPSTEEADTGSILKSIQDPRCLAVRNKQRKS